MPRMINVEVDKCVACKACELACAIAHSAARDLHKAVEDGEKPGHRVNIEAYGHKAVPISCNHCEEAACMIVCPTGALHRETPGGPVLPDKERCVGCRMCVQACPFGVISVDAEGKGVLKCDLCIERLAEGQDPACVSACLTKALSFASQEDANVAKRKRLAAAMSAATEASAAEADSAE